MIVLSLVFQNLGIVALYLIITLPIVIMPNLKDQAALQACCHLSIMYDASPQRHDNDKGRRKSEGMTEYQRTHKKKIRTMIKQIDSKSVQTNPIMIMYRPALMLGSSDLKSHDAPCSVSKKQQTIHTFF